MRRAVLVLTLGALAACAGRTAPPPGARADPGGTVTPAFQGMRTVLLRAEALAAAHDTRGLRASNAEITRYALGLLAANRPHDLRDGDVERFLDGKAAFGHALERWARANEGPDDAVLFQAIDDLVAAYWAWVDAYKGLPPERHV